MFRYIKNIITFVLYCSVCFGQNKQTVDSLLKIAKNGNENVRAKAFLELGLIYKNTANYDKALDFFYRSLKEYETTDSKTGPGVVCNNIADVLERNFQEDKAINYYQKALKANTLINNKNEMAHSLAGVGHCNEDFGKYDTALYYYKLALDICVEDNNKTGISATGNDMVGIYHYFKQYMKAIEYANVVLRIDTELRDTVRIAIDLNNIGNSYLGWGKTDSAIVYFNKGAFLAKRINYLEALPVLYKNLSKTHEKTGNYKDALDYYKLYALMNDSVFRKDQANTIVEMQTKYDSERKERQNEALNIKSEKRTLLAIIAFSGCACLLLVLLLFIIRNNHRKKQKQIEFEKNMLEFEQQALRAQMNPHFIFNAINSIQKYILKKNQQEAYDYLAKFAKLIRIVLNNSQEKVLMLEQELEMIKLYVELEQLRFNNKFEFNLNVNANAYEVPVPAMLIQPYVENAIWHGLMNLEGSQKGILSIEITQDEGVLKIVIEDNGIGREKAKQYKREDRHRSVGMALTEKRLVMMNKMQEYENAKVTVIDLKGERGGASGTRVEIYLPLNGK
jgi:tetratricopeptide (TPR) repeat protein